MSIPINKIYLVNKSCSKVILTLAFVILNVNCNTYIIKRMGIKNPKHKTSKEIEKFASKYIHYPGIHLQQNNNYYDFFHKKDSIMKLRDSTTLDSFKVFIQPLQALYFDTTQNIKSVLINCYAEQEGFNLNWNTNNRLDFFLPLTHTNVFGKIKLMEILKLTNMNTDTIYNKNNVNTVVVFWNLFLNKQTIRFLEAIQDNFKKAKTPIKVYYINNDNSFYNN